MMVAFSLVAAFAIAYATRTRYYSGKASRYYRDGNGDGHQSYQVHKYLQLFVVFLVVVGVVFAIIDTEDHFHGFHAFSGAFTFLLLLCETALGFNFGGAERYFSFLANDNDRTVHRNLGRLLMVFFTLQLATGVAAMGWSFAAVFA